MSYPDGSESCRRGLVDLPAVNDFVEDVTFIFVPHPALGWVLGLDRGIQIDASDCKVARKLIFDILVNRHLASWSFLQYKDVPSEECNSSERASSAFVYHPDNDWSLTVSQLEADAPEVDTPQNALSKSADETASRPFARNTSVAKISTDRTLEGGGDELVDEQNSAETFHRAFGPELAVDTCVFRWQVGNNELKQIRLGFTVLREVNSLEKLRCILPSLSKFFFGRGGTTGQFLELTNYLPGQLALEPVTAHHGLGTPLPSATQRKLSRDATLAYFLSHRLLRDANCTYFGSRTIVRVSSILPTEKGTCDTAGTKTNPDETELRQQRLQVDTLVNCFLTHGRRTCAPANAMTCSNNTPAENKPTKAISVAAITCPPSTSPNIGEFMSRVFLEMVTEKKRQFVFLSGIQGAGKTYAFYQALDFLFTVDEQLQLKSRVKPSNNVSRSFSTPLARGASFSNLESDTGFCNFLGDSRSFRQKLDAALFALEAFGSAVGSSGDTPSRNTSHSRTCFCIVTDLIYSSSGPGKVPRLKGAHFSSPFLDVNRVLAENLNESFNILAWLYADDSKSRRLISSLEEALLLLGFSLEELSHVTAVLAAILILRGPDALADDTSDLECVDLKSQTPDHDALKKLPTTKFSSSMRKLTRTLTRINTNVGRGKVEMESGSGNLKNARVEKAPEMTGGLAQVPMPIPQSLQRFLSNKISPDTPNNFAHKQESEEAKHWLLRLATAGPSSKRKNLENPLEHDNPIILKGADVMNQVHRTPFKRSPVEAFHDETLALETCASILQIDAGEFSDAMSIRRGDTESTGVLVPGPISDAAVTRRIARRSVARFLYQRIVEWLIRRLNEALCPPLSQKERSNIGGKEELSTKLRRLQSNMWNTKMVDSNTDVEDLVITFIDRPGFLQSAERLAPASDQSELAASPNNTSPKAGNFEMLLVNSVSDYLLKQMLMAWRALPLIERLFVNRVSSLAEMFDAVPFGDTFTLNCNGLLDILARFSASNMLHQTTEFRRELIAFVSRYNEQIAAVDVPSKCDGFAPTKPKRGMVSIKPDGLDRSLFVVRHSYGEVTYDSIDWLDKQSVGPSQRAIALIWQSDNPVLRAAETTYKKEEELKSSDKGASLVGTPQRAGKDGSLLSIGLRLKNKLAMLEEALKNGTVWQIACMRPSLLPSPSPVIDGPLLFYQLQGLHLSSVVQLCLTGEFTEVPLRDFVREFSDLGDSGFNEGPTNDLDDADMIKIAQSLASLLKGRHNVSDSSLEVGTDAVFVRREVLDKLRSVKRDFFDVSLEDLDEEISKMSAEDLKKYTKKLHEQLEPFVRGLQAAAAIALYAYLKKPNADSGIIKTLEQFLEGRLPCEEQSQLQKCCTEAKVLFLQPTNIFDDAATGTELLTLGTYLSKLIAFSDLLPSHCRPELLPWARVTQTRMRIEGEIVARAELLMADRFVKLIPIRELCLCARKFNVIHPLIIYLYDIFKAEEAAGFRTYFAENTENRVLSYWRKRGWLPKRNFKCEQEPTPKDNSVEVSPPIPIPKAALFRLRPDEQITQLPALAETKDSANVKPARLPTEFDNFITENVPTVPKIKERVRIQRPNLRFSS